MEGQKPKVVVSNKQLETFSKLRILRRRLSEIIESVIYTEVKPLTESKFQNLILSTIRLSVLLLISVFSPFVLILLTLSAIPIFLFRYTLSKLVKYIRPDFGNILTARSTINSFDKLYEPNPANGIGIVITLKGNISLESLNKAFNERIFLSKLSTGEIQYPELKQYPVDWMGFKFWKNDENFQIDNHIKLFLSSEAKVTEFDIASLRQDTFERAFKRQQSPWEITLINNYYPNKETTIPHSVLLIRCHHSLADGFSLLKLGIEGLFGQDIPKRAEADPNAKTFLQSCKTKIKFIFRAIVEIPEHFLRNLRPSPWDSMFCDRGKTVHAITGPINLKSLNAAKKEMNVSLSSMITAACASSINTMMSKKGMQIPQGISCMLPLPVPDHPDKLRNHMTHGVLTLPLASASSTKQRIDSLNKSYKSLLLSSSPVFNFLLEKVFGSLTNPLANTVLKCLFPSVFISNFPIGIKSLEFETHQCVDLYFYCGLLNLPVISFWISSFGGSLRVASVADTSVMSYHEIQELSICIENELQFCTNHSLV